MLLLLYLLAAIRFIRHIVGTKDDFYNRHLVKNNSFAPILTLFVENKVERTNLIHSAIIELFEFVRTVRGQHSPVLD